LCGLFCKQFYKCKYWRGKVSYSVIASVAVVGAIAASTDPAVMAAMALVAVAAGDCNGNLKMQHSVFKRASLLFPTVNYIRIDICEITHYSFWAQCYITFLSVF